jgi:hypothetical protein
MALLNLPHFLFDFLEVFGREGRGAVEIVVEAVIDGRSDAQLGIGIELQHGRGQKVGGGMAIDHQRFGILGGEDLKGGVLFDGTGQVVKLAVDLGDDGGVGEARADGFGDIDGAVARGDRLLAAVGQSDLDVAHREFSV